MSIHQSSIWQKAFRVGETIAGDYTRAGTSIGDGEIIWALLCDAHKVLRLAYSGPPRSGYPTKSSLPDTPDEVTYWHKLSAYLSNDAVDEIPEIEGRPPMPSAEDVTRAEIVIDVFHHAVTLGRDKKRAVYLKACGKRPRSITRITGLDTTSQKAAKRRAVSQMLAFISARMA